VPTSRVQAPYEFPGLALEALRLLSEVRKDIGLPVVTEVTSTENVDLICKYADMLQVGARNMQNFALLRRVAKVDKPIFMRAVRRACTSDGLRILVRRWE
jgi:3-deoxy-7-phosphoheptulonate synthase